MPRLTVLGSKDAYKVTGKHEITVDLPAYTITVLRLADGRPGDHAGARLQGHQAGGAARASGEHVAGQLHGQDIGREELHRARRRRHGALDRAGLRPRRARPTRYARNEKYWRPTTRQREEFYVVNIKGTDSVLSALKAGGDRRARPDVRHRLGGEHDRSKSWGKVQTFDSFKWQHVCYNLQAIRCSAPASTRRSASRTRRARSRRRPISARPSAMRCRASRS